MTIVKQIGKLTAEIEHTQLGELTMRVVAAAVPVLEKDALNELANALVAALHDELQGRGML